MLPIRCPNSSCCPFSIFNAASARSASLMMNRYFPAGILSLTATYNGDSQLGRSISAPLSQVIHQATSTTGIKSSLNPSVLGGSVTFTATVSSATASAVPGTVTFRKGSTILGTVTLSSRKANFTTSALPRGSFTIKATYNGSPNIIGSAASLIQVVNWGPSRKLLWDELEVDVTSPFHQLLVDANPRLLTNPGNYLTRWFGGSSQMRCVMSHLPLACFRRSAMKFPRFCHFSSPAWFSIVQATSLLPRRYAIRPSPPTSSMVCANRVIVVFTLLAGHQNSLIADIPTTGGTPWCGINTASMANVLRTASAFPDSQPLRKCSNTAWTAIWSSREKDTSVPVAVGTKRDIPKERRRTVAAVGLMDAGALSEWIGDEEGQEVRSQLDSLTFFSAAS